ncbi:MAG TPA: hypothetical protein VN645_12210, partial [Steroidobacteraceae bacterium]|nr:hypothetical protein [Steroidobacteraceae bacterium]
MIAITRKCAWAPFLLALCPGLLAAGEAPAKTGAPFPKGHYAALDRLPDWGGVWVLSRGRPAPGSPPAEQPRLKGEYLAKYQAWQSAVRNNNG